jgi:tRNA dimethylallyltransferase
MTPDETSREPELLVVVGPTASGKTELAIRLAQALDGEVINADSVQVYRYFDIGSGKPTPEELASVPHHLVSALDPMDELDAARWAALAEIAVTDVISRGKRPIVCGGSFLWVRALLFGLAAAPKADAELRAAHKAFVEAQGRAALHERLAQVDPVCATKLSPNDFVRVSRALEVFELTGTPMSQWQAEHGFRRPKRPYRLLGVARERAEMDERIYTRAKTMLALGFVEEVLGLCKRGYGSARAMGSVGYREVKAAVDVHLESGEPVDRGALLDAIAQKTRVFARRQRTWLRDEPVAWVKPDEMTERARLVEAVNTANPAQSANSAKHETVT